MPIILYRRHTKRCPTQDPTQKEYKWDPRRKRRYTACDCPIWVAGNVDGHSVDRESCGTTDWAEAERQKKAIEAKLKNRTEYTLPPSGPAPSDRKTLMSCMIRYLESRDRELTAPTRSHYKLLFGWLRVYAAKKRVHYMDELTKVFLDDFKSEGLPSMKDSSKALYVSKLRAFLKEAEAEEWIAKPLVYRIKPHRFVRPDDEKTQPFNEKEIEKLLNAACIIDRLVFRLMLETGLRISDAMRFDPEWLKRGDRLWRYHFRMTKRKRLANTRDFFDVFISDELKRAIDEARTEWLSPNRPFWHGTAGATYKRIYKEMQRIGEASGIADCRPHRLRDSFAVRKLAAGLSLDDVSRLLGHASVTMTEKAYAPWTPTREQRLEGIVAASLNPSVINAPSNLDGNA